jgi:hypothetical protein
MRVYKIDSGHQDAGCHGRPYDRADRNSRADRQAFGEERVPDQDMLFNTVCGQCLDQNHQLLFGSGNVPGQINMTNSHAGS